jgi:alcohol dehydrogenase
MADHRTPRPLDSDGSQALCADLLTPFDYDPRTRVVFGGGAVERLGELAYGLGGTRAFVVTDKGLKQAGHEERVINSLRKAGLAVALFDDVNANPTTEDVDRALAVAVQERVDLLVGLGGGSSLDCAKGVNFLFSNGGRMEDYRGMGKARKPFLPMIAVPTTAGTGSEAQSYALIADAMSHMKMACGDKKAACRVAILDPELTVSMPRLVTAATGIDALSHALETFVANSHNAISMLFSRRAWRLLAHGFQRVLDEPDNVNARAAMLLGANLAGAAIENSMLGAAHALANPLSAHFNLTHGLAIGIVLPHVIRFNGETVAALYGELAADAGLCAANDPEAPRRLAEFVQSMIVKADCPTSLAAVDADAALIPVLAEEAAAQWTGTFNPRPVHRQQFEELYRCAFSNPASQIAEY